jgi:nitrogen regulatory protein PII-like uncharacterized protein
LRKGKGKIEDRKRRKMLLCLSNDKVKKIKKNLKKHLTNRQKYGIINTEIKEKRYLK